MQSPRVGLTQGGLVRRCRSSRKTTLLAWGLTWNDLGWLDLKWSTFLEGK
jgi:hypothetical protein